MEKPESVEAARLMASMNHWWVLESPVTEEEETATGSTPARREAKSNCKRAWETGEAPSRDVT